MSWTKRQFVVGAYEEVGLASYVYDMEPDDLQLALRRLDAMMAQWNLKGIRIGYPLPSTQGASDLDDATTVPDSANEAIFTGLAIRIAPGLGKTVSSDTKITHRLAYKTLLGHSAKTHERQLPGTMPRGQGQKPWRNNNNEYIDKPTDDLQAGDDSFLDFD